MKDKVYGFNLMQGKVVMMPCGARDRTPVSSAQLSDWTFTCLSGQSEKATFINVKGVGSRTGFSISI